MPRQNSNNMLKYKEGQKVIITGDSCGHGKSIGSRFILGSRHKDGDEGRKNKAWKITPLTYILESDFRLLPEGYKVNYILKYDLDVDPIEEFETLEEVKERIEFLVKNERSLKQDSMVVYEIKHIYPIKVETKIEITGI